MAESYKILCIDRGGTRGVIPGRIIQNICKDADRKPQDLFYLMAGTSTGAILCTPFDTLLRYRHGHPAEKRPGSARQYYS